MRTVRAVLSKSEFEEGSRALCPALFLVGGTLFPDTQGAQYIRAATKLVGQPLRTSYRLIEAGGGLSLGLYSYMLTTATPSAAKLAFFEQQVASEAALDADDGKGVFSDLPTKRATMM